MEGKERSIRQMTERSAPGLPKKGLWEGTGGAEPSLHWPGRRGRQNEIAQFSSSRLRKKSHGAHSEFNSTVCIITDPAIHRAEPPRKSAEIGARTADYRFSQGRTNRPTLEQ